MTKQKHPRNGTKPKNDGCSNPDWQHKICLTCGEWKHDVVSDKCMDCVHHNLATDDLDWELGTGRYAQ